MGNYFEQLELSSVNELKNMSEESCNDNSLIWMAGQRDHENMAIADVMHTIVTKSIFSASMSPLTSTLGDRLLEIELLQRMKRWKNLEEELMGKYLNCVNESIDKIIEN